jgi:ABC-type transport system substrate-binding protein
LDRVAGGVDFGYGVPASERARHEDDPHHPAVLAAVLVLTAPAFAKDPWVVAFGEEPFTLNPAGKGALAAGPDYVQIHIFDALVDFTGLNLILKPMPATRWRTPPRRRGGSTCAAT